MAYSDRALAFATIPAGHQVRLEDRVSFAYIEMSAIYQLASREYAIRVAGAEPPEAVDLDGLQLIATRYSGSMISPERMSTKSSDG